ncbi:opioid growth factor receptor conserved region-domain-containing protein [Phaeosphaeriaceae sp. PMI808]|nr:opioid growth factor receptor conserved region-domain-containing protein [Phaeosphaeriaceae sp. PMI808]
MLSTKRFKFPGMKSSKPSPSAPETPLIVRFYDAEIQAKDSHGRTQEEILAWPNSELEYCHNYIQMLFPVPEGSAFNWDAPIIDREIMDAFRARSDLRNQLRKSFERMLEFYGFTVVTQLPKPEDEDDDGNKATATEGTDDEVVGAKALGEKEVEMTQESHSTEQEEETNVLEAEVLKSSFTNESTVASETKDTTKDNTIEAQNHKDTDASSSTSPPSYCIVRAPYWPRSFRTWAVRFDHNHLRITRILRCLRVLGLQTESDAFFTALKHVYNDPDIIISARSLMYWQRATTLPLYIAPDDDRVEWLRVWEMEQREVKRGEAEEGGEEGSRKRGRIG